MLGRHLRFLAEVADLARLDFEAASISLITQGDSLYSRYKGSYSGGQRWLTQEEVGEVPLPDLNVAVSALQFKSLVGLMDDESEVEVIVRDNGIRLISGERNIDLALRAGGVDDLEPHDVEGDLIAMTTVQVFQREAETASEFAARSMARPVLTGLRVIGSADGRLAIEASDGISALYLAKFAIDQSQQFELIVPAFDTVLGLKLIREGPVAVLRSPRGNQLILVGQRAIFRSSVVMGEWPNSSRIRQEVIRQEPIQIPAGILRALVSGVRILGTSNDLILKGDGTMLRLETSSSEMGAFRDAVPSAVQGTFIYDVGNFLLALNLGGAVLLHLPKEGAVGVPTLLESGHRQYWIGQRMYNQTERPLEAAASLGE